MTWAYSGDPAASPIDTVHFLVGDTIAADPQIQNEEIAWSLAQNGNDLYLTAIACCRRLQAHYTRRANKSTGNLSIQAASVATQYGTLLKTLKEEAARHSGVKPYAGGIRVSDMETEEGDTDRVTPAFWVGQDDITGTLADLSSFDREIPE